MIPAERQNITHQTENAVINNRRGVVDFVIAGIYLYLLVGLYKRKEASLWVISTPLTTAATSFSLLLAAKGGNRQQRKK